MPETTTRLLCTSLRPLGYPEKPVWQPTYFKSAALLVRKRSQRSHGEAVLICSIYCLLSPDIKASRCTLRMLHMGNA